MQPFDFIWKTHRRWRAELRASLLGAAMGRSSDERFASDRSYDRAEAKYLFVAVAPFLLLILSDQLHGPRGLLYYGWASISCVWFVLVSGLLAKVVLGVMREVLDRRSERHPD